MNNSSDIKKRLQEQVDLCFQKNREATFKPGIFSEKAKCSAAKLAEAGFVFEGSQTEPDAVHCFVCKKSLDCWNEDDDPWEEHRKHSPNCPFIKLDKPEDALTLSEFIDIRNTVIEKFYEDLFKRNLEWLDSLRPNVTNH